MEKTDKLFWHAINSMIPHKMRNYKKRFRPYRLLTGDVLLTSPCSIYQRGEVVRKRLAFTPSPLAIYICIYNR